MATDGISRDRGLRHQQRRAGGCCVRMHIETESDVQGLVEVSTPLRSSLREHVSNDATLSTMERVAITYHAMRLGAGEGFAFAVKASATVMSPSLVWSLVRLSADFIIVQSGGGVEWGARRGKGRLAANSLPLASALRGASHGANETSASLLRLG